MVDLVTITGADDSTDIKELMELSYEYPFVEWGILVSKRQQGSYRFPSQEWMSQFAHVASHNNMKVSMHMCGRWVRELLMGELNWSAEINQGVLAVANRIQINTHAEPHHSADKMADNLKDPDVYGKYFIMQWDGVNGHLVYAMKASTPLMSILFDTSGGAGVSPERWPKPLPDFRCGYAGGIGPGNVLAEIARIDEVCPNHYWIDMERRVRTVDDSSLDMNAVRLVLEQVDPIVRFTR